MFEKTMMGAVLTAALVANAAVPEAIDAPHFNMRFECFGDDGALKWQEEGHNTVMTGGKNDIIDKYFKGAAYTAAWFLGLKGTGVEVVGDTLASHATWSEVTPYAGNRPAITFGTTVGGSNTATQIDITINAGATVAGGFIASVATGTAGVLYSAKDFAAPRSVLSGDTLRVTLTVSAT